MRIYPFKKKKVAGSEKWYEKISFTYSGSLSNSISTKESELLGKSLVKDCNSEMEQLEESLIGMPTAIYELNFKLMIASMEVCYSKLHSNTERINEIDAWLSTTRKELTKQVIRLQEGEAENFNLYSYMHQIFGPEVLDIFDMAYDPEREHKVRSGDIIE